MERKPNIRQNPTFLPKYPKSVPQVYNKNLPKIDDIFGKFITSEYPEILEVINSGEVLNFRNKEGKTLIHAVINNESGISETNKLSLIKELVNKNVSINAMDEYNRNALHYASEKGYTSIIEYLISIGCDKKLIDNDGNAPIHIFVNKFIMDCKDKLYDPLNKLKNISESPEFNKTSDIMKSILMAKIVVDLKGPDIDTLINFIKKLVEANKYFNEKNINNMFNEKNKDFLNIFKKITTDKNLPSNLNELVKENIQGLENDTKGLYDDFNLLEYDSNFDDLLEKINQQSKVNQDNINRVLKNIDTEINTKSFKSVESAYNNNYLTIDKIFKSSYYLFYLCFSALRPYGNRTDIPTNIYFPDLNNVNEYIAPIIKFYDYEADLRVNRGNPGRIGNTCDSYDLNPDNKKYLLDSGIPILNILYSGRDNTFNIDNSLFCENTWINNGIINDGTFDQQQANNILNNEFKFTNKMLIYNVAGNALNDKYCADILNFIKDDLTVENNEDNEKIYFNYSRIDVQTLGSTFYDESQYLNWNLKWADEQKLKNMQLLKLNNEQFQINYQGFNPIFSFNSEFLLSKFPKKLSTNEKINKELNQVNIDRILSIIKNEKDNEKLTDAFILSDLNNIIKTNNYFRCTGKTPIPRCGTPNMTELQRQLSDFEANFINQIQPRSNPAINSCDIDIPRPDYMTLIDLLEEKNQILNELLSDANYDYDDFEQHDKIKRTYLIKKILENNYPKGFGPEINKLKLSDFNRVNKYGNISFIFNYIIKCFGLVEKIIPSDINNPDNLQSIGIYINLELLNQVHNILLSGLINLGLLYDILNKLDLSSIEYSYRTLEQIYKNIVNDENNSNFSKNVFKESFEFILEDIEQSVIDLKTYRKDKKYLEDFEKIYESVLKLFSNINELRDNFNKTQSLVYLKNFVLMLKNNEDKSISNFYVNKIDVDFKAGFPNKFIDFKEKYILGTDIQNLSDNIDMKKIITELYPYYYPYNYNIIYNIQELTNSINNFEILKLDSNFTKRKNLTWDCVTKNTMFIKYPLLIGEFKFNFITIENDNNLSSDRIPNVYDIITRKFDYQYKFGYPFIPNISIMRNPQEKARFENYIDQKRYYNSLYFVNDDSLFNMQIDDSAPYQNLYLATDDNFPISTDLDISSLALISLLNSKELINSLVIKITDVIKTNGTDYFTGLQEAVENNLLDKEDKNNNRIIFEQIEANQEIKDSIIFDIVQQLINMIIKSNTNIELKGICKKYFDDIIRGTDKFKIEYPDIEFNTQEELEGIIKKKSKILSNILPTMIDNVDSQVLFSKPNYIKIIDDKCVDMNMVDKVIKMNMRIEDINGNTILNKLISQYNIYGIKKIIGFDKELKSYKNSRGENSLEYIINLIKSIQNDYVSNIDLRIKQYSEVLLNEINENKKEKYQGLSIDSEQNIVSELLKMCIYMFNEFIWIKMIGFPNGWTIDDKIKINKILSINPEKENLLINTFDSENEKELTESNISNINNKIRNELEKGIEDEICDLKNKIEQLKNAQNASNLIKNTPSLIADLTQKISNKELELNRIKQGGTTKISSLKYDIQSKINKYSNLLINNNNSIDYEKYNEMVQEIILNYLDVIKILNNKVVNSTPNDKTISDSQICLIELKPNIITDKNNLAMLSNYYSKIIDKLYGEYNDLDKYEDAEYNTVNYSMLSIIKINIINVMAEEITKLLIEYIQNNYSSTVIKELNRDIAANYSTIHNKLFGLVRNYLTSSMNQKLGTTNPDKEINLDIIKTRLVKSIFTIFGLTLELEGEQLNEIVTFIDFYTEISDNLSTHAYTEMLKLLVNMKKIGLLIEIYNLLDN